MRPAQRLEAPALPALAVAPAPSPATPRLLALVGNPNVGKSVLFNNLTGSYVTVSNYPGTTVDVSSGEATIGALRYRVLDTPGMYSTTPISGEEQVARRVLLEDRPETVVQVADAKNLARSLPLTFELLELGQRVVLVLNILDEAERLGLRIDLQGLSSELGIPVVGAVATTGRGTAELQQAVEELPRALRGEEPVQVPYPAEIERAIDAVSRALPPSLQDRARGLSLLLLEGDEELAGFVKERAPDAWPQLERLIEAARLERGLAYALARARHAHSRALVDRHLRHDGNARPGFAERLSEWTIRPWTGVPLLLLVLYFGLYQFVGVFGAGTVVDFLENTLFGQYLVAPVNTLLERTLAGDGWRYWARELVGGEYGLVTLGISYAFAIVLPIVGLFFLFFSLLEDSGYFPRLALLLDGVFKRIGLNGRAVIPIVLGFGCVTMATMVTRIQETKRERLLTTLLLALAIPCSAQYGVIAALLAAQPGAFLGVSGAFAIWAGLLTVMFLATGLLASKVLPGQAASFYMELPPLRLPRAGNVLLKTLARLKWYFLEVFPLFLLASVLIWAGRLTGLFDAVVALMAPVVGLLGLPPKMAEIFLYGFFRRDFGAAGLFELSQAGALSGAQILVACITLTLFLPCVAQLLIMKKERGPKAAALIAGGVVVIALSVGALSNLALTAWGFGR